MSSQDGSSGDEVSLKELNMVLIEVEAQAEVEAPAVKWSSIEVPSSLQNFNCFFNWVPPGNPLTSEELQMVTTAAREKYAVLKGSSPQLLEQLLRASPMEAISEHLHLSFYHLVMQDFDGADKGLAQSAEIIFKALKGNLIPAEYLEGLNYVFQGLEAFRKSLLVESEVEEFVAYCDLHSNLPPLAKVAVSGVHLFFAGARREGEEELKLLKEILAIDPDNVEWIVKLIGVQRILRRSSKPWDRQSRGGSEEDKRHLVKALELDKDHVLVQMELCTYLSDLIKSHRWGHGNLKLGELKFVTEKEVVDLIIDTALEIIPKARFSSKVNMAIAEIFSKTLPPQYRDIRLAKNCLEVALQINPKSSKPNHRMGNLLLILENNPNEALPYFQKAADFEPRNFPAWIDYAHLLLRDAKNNSKKLKEIFEEKLILNGAHWENSRLSSISLVKGYFHLICGDADAAVVSWLKAYKLDAAEVMFNLKKIVYLGQRYGWNRKQISQEKIHEVLKKVVAGNTKLSLTSGDEGIIGKLKAIVDVGQKVSSFGRSDSFRGNRGGGRVNQEAARNDLTRTGLQVSSNEDNGENNWRFPPQKKGPENRSQGHRGNNRGGGSGARYSERGGGHKTSNRFALLKEN